MHESWQAVLGDELETPRMHELRAFLVAEVAAGRRFYPPADLVFNALALTPFDAVRVVILGQDPYHGAGQAMGLCFSVPDGVPTPPSLRNIYEELARDVGVPQPSTGDLTPWAERGVLLLNAVLTVSPGKPASHAGRALLNVLESYPRDELFQIDDDTLYHFALDILNLSERPRVRVLARPDEFDRFVLVLVFIPKDR